MKKLSILLLTLLIPILAFAFTYEWEIDSMEYSTDALAQAAYVSNGADFIFDQETTNNENNKLGDSADSEIRITNKLVLTTSKYITEVRFTFNANTGSPSGQVTCRIETNNAGEPSGTLANANATKAITPSASTENTWTFATPFNLAAGTYWIKLDCDNQATNVNWRVAENYGIGGGLGRAGISTDGSWTIWDDRTHTFKIYTLALQSYSEDTIIQEGTYSLKGEAVITDSLNDTLTNTVDGLNLTNSKGIEYDIYALRTGSNIKIGIHDSGGTTSEHTANVASSNTNQTESWDMSEVSDANKDDIDSIIITILNADAANTFYIDDIKWGITAGGGSYGFVN